MNDSIVPPLRKCTKCGEEKPETAEYFARHVKGRLGLYTQCRECTKVANNAIYAANREARAQQMREYRAQYPDKVNEQSRRSYQNNREKELAGKKRYAAENPEKLLEHWRRMAAMRKNAPGSHTKEQEIAMHDEQEGRCGYCGITLHDDWVPDHKYPIARGGSDDIENIIVCCPPCNNSKHKSTVEEWMKRRGW